MKARKIYVVVPFSRPNFLKNIINNFTQQSFVNKKLIIIENGDAIGACNSIGFKPNKLLTSGKHQSFAKNAGLDYLREIKAEFWTTFDDDDYYGPGYLEELSQVSNKAEFIGKQTMFCKTQDDKLRLFKSLVENDYCIMAHGPTISGWVSETSMFHNTGVWGEDLDLIRRAINDGARCYASSRYNFIFQRHINHNHTWKATDHQISQCWYHSGGDMKVIEYDGTIEQYKDFVDGKIELTESKVVAKLKYEKEHSPGITYVISKCGEMEDWCEKMMKGIKL